MNRCLACLCLLAAITLAGCGATEFTQENDTVNAQQRALDARGVPGPTEMPPGLGDDLPRH